MAGRDRDENRGDRERPSWSELDRRRDRGRSGRQRDDADRPRGRVAEERAARETRDALREADALFRGDAGGDAGAELAKAVRDAHGSPELVAACREYVAALGTPSRVDLLTIFLDTREPDLTVSALEKMLELSQRGKLERTSALKTQLRALTQDPDDDVAGLAEELLG